MAEDVIAAVRAAMARSELATAAISVRRDAGYQLGLGDVPLRQLTAQEIGQLESLGNFAAEWPRIRVVHDFDCARVRQSSFHGDVILGRFTEEVTAEEGMLWPTGIYRSTVANCVIGHNALIRDVKLLYNYVVGPDAKLYNCATIACSAATTFGNGQALSLGLEGGGREVPIFAEIDVQTAAALACGPSRHSLWQSHARAIVEYLGLVASTRGIIEAGAFLRDTPSIRNTYVGKYARIDGATFVSECTLLSSKHDPTQVLSGACVSHSLFQKGSRVTTLAIVERSVLTEHAEVEQHGKVTGSLLGPGTRIVEGEVAGSLLGPKIGLHHQALLRAVLWPEGKGHVSHGANVGSNHIATSPEEEFKLGEGTFLGLGVNIKFPADFSRSPYSIIAGGVSTQPQKVMFPFSLVDAPSARWEGIPFAHNEIFPAWVLTEDLYSLKRMESKFRPRGQARPPRLEFDMFRPDLIDLMLDACRRLQAVPSPREVYTELDVKGLGKNVLLEANRRRAIDAYQFFIKYYALLGLKARLHETSRGMTGRVHGSLGAWRSYARTFLLETSSDEPRWEHQRKLLKEEMHCRDLTEALGQLPGMLETVAQAVELAKAKNDERGSRIIDDYANTHVGVGQDVLVQETWNETRRMQEEVSSLLGRLKLQETPQEEAQGQ